MYRRPSQIKWFLGLQILAAGVGAVLVVAARNDVFWQIGLLYLVFLLVAYMIVKGFVIWMTWCAKNWARLTMLAWVLYTFVNYFVQLRSGATPIQLEPSLKAVGFVVLVLQVSSITLLFTPPANEWFRHARAKRSLVFPR